jgi:DNA-binding IclR family transcriptional regulator
MGTITKALDLLSLFTADRAEIGLGEFVRLTGRDKATVHRHLTELHENGFLEQHPTTRAYRLGPAILRLAALRETLFPVRRLLQPLVTELSQTTGELAHASLLQGDALSPVAHADPHTHGIQVHFDPAEMLPMHATSSGLAVLAFLPERDQTRILNAPLKAHTSRTITDPGRLRAQIEQTRQTGLARVESGFDEDVHSMGTPLFGEEGRVIGAMAIAVPVVRAKDDRLGQMAAELHAMADRATRSLGGTRPRFDT